MHADAITHIGRNTRGVRVMNVKNGYVATVDVTERDNEAEVEAPEETEASAEALEGETEVVETETTETVETTEETQE